ncbi:hypothetical protein Moror_8198 [Moniliophthora roreri MCA 2997]|uniref:Uncharacterized protein n=2 Tax=Moniliophthora roreri TaxID=221103 RepID=V2X596_MONRO|nr:hypothetical protein Moror_8198 [Moniliophthora roreri MCA 2997]KAI3606336.1 hypothetical protein WG66_009581 [Moniliophthora roreri]
MYIPFISQPRVKNFKLERRKGGGGHGGGHGGGGGKGGGGKGGGGSRGGSSSASRSGTGRTKSTTIYGSTSSMTSYGRGGGPVSTVPEGQKFAGRSVGGGDRSSIYGSRTYGSGYPSQSSTSVQGRGFPYYFWPLTFIAGVAAGGGLALGAAEYGSPNDTSRPGGPILAAAFQSLSTSSNQTVLKVVADTDTTAELVSIIKQNCSSLLDTKADDNQMPLPEEVVQYYRASSVALTLVGYNNSAVYNNSVEDTPIPSGVDMVMLNCVNQTIGAGVPLIDGSAGVRVIGWLWTVVLGVALSNLC